VAVVLTHAGRATEGGSTGRRGSVRARGLARVAPRGEPPPGSRVERCPPLTMALVRTERKLQAPHAGSGHTVRKHSGHPTHGRGPTTALNSPAGHALNGPLDQLRQRRPAQATLSHSGAQRCTLRARRPQYSSPDSDESSFHLPHLWPLCRVCTLTLPSSPPECTSPGLRQTSPASCPASSSLCQD
jgi:hypothetical protein